MQWCRFWSSLEAQVVNSPSRASLLPFVFHTYIVFVCKIWHSEALPRRDDKLCLILCFCYLFFKCDLASWLWSRLGLWVKSSIPTFDSITDCFAWVDSSFQVPSKAKIVKSIVAALIKSIWTHRNNIIFNNKRVDKDFCLRRMMEFSYHWMCNRSSLHIQDLNSWMSNPFYNS